MVKQAIYFYKENKNNIAIVVNDYNDIKTVIFPSSEELELIRSKFPKTKENLYVLVDGVIFKLKN